MGKIKRITLRAVDGDSEESYETCFTPPGISVTQVKSRLRGGKNEPLGLSLLGPMIFISLLCFFSVCRLSDVDVCSTWGAPGLPVHIIIFYFNLVISFFLSSGNSQPRILRI